MNNIQFFYKWFHLIVAKGYINVVEAIDKVNTNHEALTTSLIRNRWRTCISHNQHFNFVILNHQSLYNIWYNKSCYFKNSLLQASQRAPKMQWCVEMENKRRERWCRMILYRCADRWFAMNRFMNIHFCKFNRQKSPLNCQYH